MERLLVVDDDRELCDNLVEVLTSAGFAVTSADRGEKALEVVERQKFDLVLLDLIMPGLSGIEVLPLLKRKGQKIRIIMMTAFATIGGAVDAMRRGADDYLVKPFKVNELLVAIQRVLEEARLAEGAAAMDLDQSFSCLANPIRRAILNLLTREEKMRFMEVARQLEIEDHTKVNFHLKVLKDGDLIRQDSRRLYELTAEGRRVCGLMQTMKKG